MPQLSDFYERELNAPGFYAQARWRAIDNQEKGGHQFVQDTDYSGYFLRGITAKKRDGQDDLEVKNGDWRYDMPAWFSKSSDISKASHRIMVVGSEPRATNNAFNVMRSNNNVFGVAFGADRWTKGAKDDSNKTLTSQMRYANSFEPLLNLVNERNIFILFTDAVKKYEVVTETSKKAMDEKARRKFCEYFETDKFGKKFLIKEIKEINPDAIIALGNDSYRACSSILPPSPPSLCDLPIIQLRKVTHPAAHPKNKVSGKEQALRQVKVFMTELDKMGI